MDLRYKIIGAVVAFIIIIIIILSMNVSVYEKYMYGSWLAEFDDFCETAEIDSMMIHVGEKLKGKNERLCYIIISPDLCKQGFKMSYSNGWAGPWVREYKIRAKIEFEEEQLWDEYCDITINMINGTMKIVGCESKKLYALLCKQHDITNVNSDLEETEMVEAAT